MLVSAYCSGVCCYLPCHSLAFEIFFLSKNTLSCEVVFKRVPLGSLSQKFLIPGRKFVPGRNWGGKGEDEKALNFIICLSIRKKVYNQIGFDGNDCSTQGQAALTTVGN